MLPVVGLASLLQLALMFALLMGVAVSAEEHTSCASEPLIVPPERPGGAAYLDLGAPFRTEDLGCATATTRSVEQASRNSTADDFLAPLAREALVRRAARSRDDPTFGRRVDAALNEGRVNFLVFGYGDTFEPPEPVQFKGSISIFSLDLHTRELATITLNHDIRAPEIERFAHTSVPTKIHMALPVGGFELMRTTVEDATGLSVDYQIAMADGVIKRAVDEVFGELSIDSPFDLDARPIFFDGVEYPERHFPAGPQKLDGLGSLQYMKAVMKGPYDASKELAVRKQVVIKSMFQAALHDSVAPFFWTQAVGFLHSEIKGGSIGYDFDAPALVVNALQTSAMASQAANALLPRIGHSIYVVDYRSGDGGVEWVTGSANPIMIRDVASGVYAETSSFAVPQGNANPYASDLASEYWRSVRELIKQTLLADG